MRSTTTWPARPARRPSAPRTAAGPGPRTMFLIFELGWVFGRLFSFSKKQHFCFQHGNFSCQIGGGRLKSFSFFLTKVIHVYVIEIQSFEQTTPFKTNLKWKYAKTMDFCQFWKNAFFNIFRHFLRKCSVESENGRNFCQNQKSADPIFLRPEAKFHISH